MLFKNIRILDENFEIQENMNVLVTGDKIAYIGKDIPDAEYERVYDGTNKLLMPGFYNGHAHSPMALLRGYGENMSLNDWLHKKIFPFEAKLTDDAVYWGTTMAMAESLRSGIVSTQDMYYFIDSMVNAVSDAKCKNNISRSLVNFSDENLMQMPSYLEAERTLNQYQNYNNGKIKMDVSLHAEYTSSPALAMITADLAKKYDVITHVHVSETISEHEDCKKRHGGQTPVEYLCQMGMFDVPCVAAHCVHLENNDYSILKEKGVTVATNPVSNLKLSSGVCNVPKVLANGINLSIGTDSVASNNSLSMFEEMKVLSIATKTAFNNPTLITPKEALYAATRGGAIAQGRNDCGLLKEGFKADLIMVDLGQPNMWPIHNLLTNLVYSADTSNILMTVVDGEVLYEYGCYTSIDIEKTIYMVERETNKIIEQL